MIESELAAADGPSDTPVSAKKNSDRAKCAGFRSDIMKCATKFGNPPPACCGSGIRGNIGRPDISRPGFSGKQDRE